MLDFEILMARVRMLNGARLYAHAKMLLGYSAGSSKQGQSMTAFNHVRAYYRHKIRELHELLFARHLTNVPPKGWKTWAFDEESGYRVKTG